MYQVNPRDGKISIQLDEIVKKDLKNINNFWNPISFRANLKIHEMTRMIIYRANLFNYLGNFAQIIILLLINE
jgi:hypothetical protein